MLFGILYFIFGLILGSFLNVVILRYNTGKSISGRSSCATCGHRLKWFELIPVFSFLFLNGRCRKCDAKISLQYPLVELLTGIIFYLIWLNNFNFSQNILAIGLSLTLIFITVYDIRHKIIPNSAIILLLLIVILWKMVDFLKYTDMKNIFFLDMFFGSLIVSLPIALLWYFSKGKAIGFGDAKLMFVLGAFLGFFNTVILITYASVLGSMYGLVLFIKQKICTHHYLSGLVKSSIMKAAIPFGPFLIFAFILIWLMGANNWYIEVIYKIGSYV